MPVLRSSALAEDVTTVNILLTQRVHRVLRANDYNGFNGSGEFLMDLTGRNPDENSPSSSSLRVSASRLRGIRSSRRLHVTL